MTNFIPITNNEWLKFGQLSKFVLQYLEIQLLLWYKRCPKEPFQQSNYFRR